MKIAAKILNIFSIVFAAFGILSHIITVPVLGTLGFVFAIVALIKAIKKKQSIVISVLYGVFTFDVVGCAVMIVASILNKKLAAKEAAEEVVEEEYAEEYVEYAE